jgi:hypothetical protein
MQAQPGSIKVTSARCRVNACQDPSHLFDMLRLQASPITGLEEPLQTAVLETNDHDESVTCNGTLVNLTLTPVGMNA